MGSRQRTDCAACLGVDPVGKTSGDPPVTIDRCLRRDAAALSAAREAAPIGLGAAVLRFRFGGIEVATPFVELFAERVYPLSMIGRAETLLFGH